MNKSPPQFTKLYKHTAKRLKELNIPEDVSQNIKKSLIAEISRNKANMVSSNPHVQAAFIWDESVKGYGHVPSIHILIK